MDERLEALIRLQEVDDAIERTREQLDLLPLRLSAAERELERGQQDRQAIHDDLVAVQKEADQAELRLHSGEATLSKLQAQRLAVKTNREYQALTTQMGGTEADNSRLEDQILALYAKIEQVQKAHRDQAGEVDRLARLRDAVREENRREAERLETDLAALQERRDAARQTVPSEALILYDRLRTRLGGPPVSAVREEVCSGCNMAVSPQTVSLLHLGRNLVQCTSCTRILYLDGD